MSSSVHDHHQTPLAPPRLKFAVGPLPEPPIETSAEPARTAVEPSDEHRLEAENLAAGIADENLRKVVAKTAALGLAKADSDRVFWYDSRCPEANCPR